MINKQENTINLKDKKILRSLAGHVAELASRPIEDEKRKLWYKHNALEDTRPVIFCDPENGWYEIITKNQLQCEGELARQWEFNLHREVFGGEFMGDDKVIEPYFNINYIYSESDWGMHETKIYAEGGGSYRWDAPLKDYNDFDKLHFPEIRIDYEASNSIFELAKEVVGDMLTVQLKGNWFWSLALTQNLVWLRGLGQSLYDMYDYPNELHRLMAFLRDGYMAKLDYLEENALFSLNNGGTYVGSGGFGYTNELPKDCFNAKKIRTYDLWGFCESQETSGVSPEMFEEFVFRYQLPLMERFGLNCYGCCEALDKRWHIVKKVPHLRRVSVSAWADLGDMAEKLGSRYIYSMKPNPADLAVAHIDEELVRKKLKEAMKITRNCRVEVIMKDNHTIARNPQNVIRWCQIAREEAELI